MSIGAGNVKYTYAQLQGLWIQAGGTKQNAAMAAAIAMAESGGNSAAYNVNTNGSIDRGLWQINSVHGLLSTFDVMSNTRAAIQLSNNGRTWTAWCTAYSDAHCGQSGGTYLGQGAPYQQFLVGGNPQQPPQPPDLTAPINGTNAAANLPNAQLTSSGCSWWEWMISPGLCGLEGGAAKVGGAAEGLAASIISGLIGSLINPLIQIVAGVLGITSGAFLMLAGVWMIMQHTQAGQKVTSEAERAAGAAAAPETGGASLAMSGGGRTGGGQRTQGYTPGRDLRRPQSPQQAQNQRVGAMATQERERRERAQMKQLSTAELLRLESLRYVNGR